MRGRARGDGRKLSQVQEDTLQRMIIGKRPEQLRIDFPLWSRAALGQPIEQALGVSNCKYAAPANSSPAGALPRKNPSSVRMNKARRRCRTGPRVSILPLSNGAEGAEIHWGDETALVNTDSKSGSTPL